MIFGLLRRWRLAKQAKRADADELFNGAVAGNQKNIELLEFLLGPDRAHKEIERHRERATELADAKARVEKLIENEKILRD